VLTVFENPCEAIDTRARIGNECDSRASEDIEVERECRAPELLFHAIAQIARLRNRKGSRAVAHTAVENSAPGFPFKGAVRHSKFCDQGITATSFSLRATWKA
jgi:hypothetical protein